MKQFESINCNSTLLFWSRYVQSPQLNNPFKLLITICLNIFSNFFLFLARDLIISKSMKHVVFLLSGNSRETQYGRGLLGVEQDSNL